MSTPPTLSIVVLQWNRSDLTRRCIDSLRSGTTADHEIVIVDNGSEPDASRFASENADVPVLLDTNTGFAHGMNAGLRIASGTHTAFVNNDTRFPDAWDVPILETIGASNVGIAVPTVTAGGNRSSVRTERGNRAVEAQPFVDLPSGVVYVMETGFIRSIGGWQEDYPVASAEDLDLLFAVWAIGLDVIIDERCLIEHEGNATAGAQLPNKPKLWRANRLLFADRWRSMDQEGFLGRYGWDGEVDLQRLAQARSVAYWMHRYFEADDKSSRPVPPKATQHEAPRRSRFRRG